MKKLIPAAGITADDVKKIVTEAVKGLRPGSKMQFDGGSDTEIDPPHRAPLRQSCRGRQAAPQRQTGRP